jgi:hypothetical protein
MDHIANGGDGRAQVSGLSLFIALELADGDIAEDIACAI